MKNEWHKLKNADLKKYLTELTKNAELLIPYKINDKWEIQNYDPEKEITLPDSIINVSLKNIFFPKRRVIAEYNSDKQWSLKPVSLPDKPRIILGAHSCDVAALQYVDRVLRDSEYKDVLYDAERERTVIIGLRCNAMEEFCHCTDRGLTPDTFEGMDAVIAKNKDDFWIAGLSDKGKKLLDSKLLEKTSETPDKKEWPKGKYKIADPDKFMAMYNDPIWIEQADICLTCGICTFSCPTCVCFLVADEQFQGKGERITVWDSCQFISYARMAGGHNERKNDSTRIRNRTLDKFAYSHDRHGRISCTGCGRCVLVCPLKKSFPQLASLITAKILDQKLKTKKEKQNARH